MRKTLLLSGVAGFAFACSSLFAAKVGSPAPLFSGTDSHGKQETLSSFRGKFVVLEWTNSECPYTRKHYESGNMEKLQKQWTARGVVWLTVLSSAPGHQGFMTPDQENSYLQREGAAPTAAILDHTGEIGRLYEAKTTPHMFVIDPTGKLIYEGAIDDHPTSDAGDIAGSRNYVSEALAAALNGKPVPTSYTRPYGCNVKYAGE
jgi:peroxiredoxin